MDDTLTPDAISRRLVAARPRAVAALLRYFRDLDLAEEAFQEACLRALRTWPANGPPRDAEGWLIMVGRNAALDQVRKQSRLRPLPPEEEISDTDNTLPDLVERLDASDYRDDILRLLFICCHPDLPATQQVALALRIVCGLSVPDIARAFLVAERAMEQRITRAKARIAGAEVPFETPGPVERAERFAAVAAMIYLVFNEGYTDADTTSARAHLCAEGIRLARLLLRLFPSEPETMGLLALMLLQHSRRRARIAPDGAPVLLDDQDRTKWDRQAIAEALALLDKAMLHRSPGPYQIQAAIAALHARAPRPEDTDWVGIDQLYAALERVAPSPVVTLNRAVAVSKVRGADVALAMTEALAGPLDGYFYFHGMRGALLDQLGRRAEAREAFGRAISLAGTASEAIHIRQHLDRLKEAAAPREENSGKIPERCRDRSCPCVLGIPTTRNQRRSTMPSPENDLVLTRIMAAPRDALWRCWTEPKLLEQWFCPKPWFVTDAQLDLVPGGVMACTMNGPEGESFPNIGVFLAVEPKRRLVTTDAFLPGWIPSERAFLTSEITFEELGDGKTRYTARAMHWSEEARQEHEKMGFHEGWGMAADQLEALAATV